MILTAAASVQWYDIIGYLAAICIGVYMVPQLIQTIKTKDTSGIAVAMFIIALLGDLFFVVDGAAMIGYHNIHGLPILLANLAALTVSAIIAFFKFRNMYRAHKMNITEKTFCSNYKENVETYKRNFKNEENKENKEN